MAADQTHLVARVASLLRVVGDVEPDGGTTSDIARRAGLARPTVHRLLTSMHAEGLVDRDGTSGRWNLGPELYLLGSLAAVRYDIADVAGDILEALAGETGESAFLSARRGDQTVCLRQEDGSFPLRSHVLNEGIRFPLGVASAGLVVLAHLPAREVDDYLERRDLTQEWAPTTVPGRCASVWSRPARTATPSTPGSSSRAAGGWRRPSSTSKGSRGGR